MIAESVGEAGGGALTLAIFALLLLLGVWNVWLNRRLRLARSFEDEVRALIGQRLGDRLDPRDPAFAAAVEAGLQAHLPEVIKREVESPSSALHTALADKLAREMTRGEDEALDARVRDALLGRIGTILAAPGDFADLFEEIDGKLGERMASRAGDATPAMVEAIDAGLRGRIVKIFETSDDFGELFEEIDVRLGERVSARIEVAEDGVRIDGLIAEQLHARVKAMFDNPESHEDLFETVDEKLGERIVRSIGRLPEDAASRMDSNIRDALVAEVQYIFDNPENYETLVETIDEQLGQRICRLLSHPSPELQQGLEEPIRAGLTRRLGEIFANPEEHEGLVEGIDEGLGKRIDRRIRDELAPGDGLLDRLIAEALRERVRERVETGRESLDQAIDTAIRKQHGDRNE